MYVRSLMERLGFAVEDTGGGCLCYYIPEFHGLGVTLGRADGSGLPTSLETPVSATISERGEDRDCRWPNLRAALREMFPDEMEAEEMAELVLLERSDTLPEAFA